MACLRHITTILALAIFCMQFGSAYALAPMPEGFRYPTVFKPSVWPGQCFSCANDPRGLYIADKDQVFKYIAPEPIDWEWTSALLRIDAGFNKPWSPEDTYSLFFGGIKGFEDYIFAAMARRMVLFKLVEDTEGEFFLRGINAPEFTIRRIDDYIVVTQKKQFRWYFETLNFGEEWRLAKIEPLKHPGMFSTLTYNEDGKITDVTYPDGKKTTLTYKNDAPLQMTHRAGHMVNFDQDKKGFLKTVSYHEISPLGKPKKKPFKYHQFLYDAKGRIARYKNEYGTEFRVVHSHKEQDKTEVFTTLIINDEDKYFSFRRTTVTPDNAWEVEDGMGHPGQSPRDALVTSYNKFKKQKHNRSVVESAANKQAPKKKTTYGKNDQVKEKVNEVGDKTKIKYDSEGNEVAITLPDGTVKSKAYRDGKKVGEENEFGTHMKFEYGDNPWPIKRLFGNGMEVHYTWDNHGHVISTRLNKSIEHFDYDKMGRLIRHTASNGKAISFDYYDNGRLKSKITYQKVDDKEPTKSEIYRYDMHGQLVETKYLNEKADVYTFKDSLLTGKKLADGRYEKYGYDKRSRLNYRVKFDGTSQRFKYDHFNRVIWQGDKEKGSIRTKVTEKSYNDRGQLTLLKQGKETTTYEYDKAGRQFRVTHPDKTITIKSYDARGRVKAIRGDKQDPVNFTYAKNGQRNSVKATNDDLDAILASIPVEVDLEQLPEGAEAKQVADGGEKAEELPTKKGKKRGKLNKRGKLEKEDTPEALPPGTKKVASDELLDWYNDDSEKSSDTKPKTAGIVALDGPMSLVDLKKHLVVFGSPDCESCNWVKFEWFPEFSQKKGVKSAYFVDIDQEWGEMLLSRLEDDIKTTGMSSPIVYYQGRLYYGTFAIGKIKGGSHVR